MAPSPAAAAVILVRTVCPGQSCFLLLQPPSRTGPRASACSLGSLLLVILYESMPVSSCHSRHRSDLTPPCCTFNRHRHCCASGPQPVWQQKHRLAAPAAAAQTQPPGPSAITCRRGWQQQAAAPPPGQQHSTIALTLIMAARRRRSSRSLGTTTHNGMSMPLTSLGMHMRSTHTAGKQTSPITATLTLTAVGAATIPGSQTSTPTHPSLCTQPPQQQPKWRSHWAQTLQPTQLAACHLPP